MKRIISGVIAVLIFLGSFLTLRTKAVKVQDNDLKEIVFMIDRSMHTDRETLLDVKEQIVKMSKEILNSGQNATISVVEFNDRASLVVKSETNLDKIKKNIKTTVPFGFSNPTTALKKADEIEFVVNKDIVLFTNFYPNIGPLNSKGKYAQRDHFYFRNANAFVDAINNLKDRTRLITVANFSKLNNRDYVFSNRLFKENSNEFYLANSKEERNIKIKELTEKILYSTGREQLDEGKKPIIFIPGIAGSELFVIDEKYLDETEKRTGLIKDHNEIYAKRIWIPVGYDRKTINEDLNINNILYGLNQGDLRNVSLLKRHVGPVALYTALIDTLIRNFPDRPVYLFSYDWRKSNLETAQKLGAFIDTINENGNVKVDIVAHSMGGLVSSHYLKYNNHKVDKFLSFGTPYEGAPKSFSEHSKNNLMGGFVHLLLEQGFGIDSHITNGFEGIAELYPTRRMIKKYPYLVSSDRLKIKEDLFKNTFYNYESLLNRTYITGSATPLPHETVEREMEKFLGTDRHSELMRKLSSYREGENISNPVHLMYRPNSMFFVGTNTPTTVSGYFVETEEGLTKVEDIMTNEGDSMVPLYSATMGMELDEMSEEVRKKFKIVNGNHLGMLVDPINLRDMVSFLSGREIK